MKVLIDNNHSFAYAHGGIQETINNLLRIVPEYNYEIEPLRWWDKNQKGDIIHLFYKPSEEYLKILNSGSKIVISTSIAPLLDKNNIDIVLRKYLYKFIKSYMPGIRDNMSLKFSDYSNAIIYHSDSEVRLGNYMYGTPFNKSFSIFPGIDDTYYAYKNLINNEREKYLVTLSTIYEVKNSVLLAKLAKLAKIPIVFLGKPYDDKSQYFKAFLSLVDNQFVIYKGDPDKSIKSKIMFYAKGFILLSKYESGPIAAAEAAACGCELIFPNKIWAKSKFDNYAHFIDIEDEKEASKQLSLCYEKLGSNQNQVFPVKNWNEFVAEIVNIYKCILR